MSDFPPVRFTTYDVSPYTMRSPLHVAMALEKGYAFHWRGVWPTDQLDLSAALEKGHVVYHMQEERAAEALLDLDRAILSLRLGDGFLRVDASARDTTAVQAAVQMLEKLYPKVPDTEEGRVTVTFWVLSPNGPQGVRRKIDVPTWSEIRENYSADQGVRQPLDELLGEFRPANGGQLLLWSGKAGTGKTWALRALAWEWRSWASIHYITDPEVLFGEKPAYLLQLLLQAGDEYTAPASEADRWMLLVLEDTGEMLAPDAKEHVGQGLSRLLNVVDGLIGQGLRILVLITTNEELGKLNEAVTRPGRCASRIEFKPLDVAEAASWMGKRGADGTPGGRTLAELFAEVEGRAAKADRVPAGFRGPG